MCLLIGCSGVGKTLLLKRLNTLSNRGSYKDIGPAPSTIPTVGTNLMNVVTAKKQQITVRELGGTMSPIWHNYYKDIDCIIFMVDLSNRAQVAASCIQFLDIISHEKVQKQAILLIFNKVDLPNSMTKIQLQELFRINDIIQQAQQRIKIIETSARDGQGLQDVAVWIQEHATPNS